MRRRILLALVVIAVASVVALGVPLTVFGRLAVRRDAAVRADKEADAIGLALADPLVAGEPIDPGSLDRFVAGGRYLVITDPAGNVIAAGQPPRDDVITADIDAPAGARIQLSVPDRDVDRRETLVMATVAGLGGAAVLAAVGLGIVVSRRVTRPLDVLAATAHCLGEGDFSARAAPTGVAEVDALAATLNDGAARIERLVAAEREFSANASHQLRTPLTAVRMRLEEIDALGDAAVRDEAAAALDQVDRLDATISDLLRLARDGNGGPTAPLDLAALARRHAHQWEHLARRQGRQIVVHAHPPAWAQASVGAAGHAVDILLENALRHGSGRVTVSVDADDMVAAIDITDEGPGVPPGREAVIFRRGITDDGSGIGLALASDLVTAEHGRLTLVTAQPPRFRITYGAAPAQSPAPAGPSPPGATVQVPKSQVSPLS